jgi:hypothetical protein
MIFCGIATEYSNEDNSMATKNKAAVAKPASEKFPRKNIPVFIEENDSEKVIAQKYAAVVTSPELAAYRVINAAEGKTDVGDGIDVPALMADLRAQGAVVNGGEMRQAEAMLINQATALQSLFARLAERGMTCTGMAQYEADMRLALRAQAQCRSTLETLAAIKNPPVIFAKQANIASGHQQINNGTPAPTHAREIEIEPNELSGECRELLPDATSSSITSRVNQEMETVGKLDRAKVRRR